MPQFMPGSCKFDLSMSGCGAVWLARRIWDAEVLGSNPSSPISFLLHFVNQLTAFRGDGLVSGFERGELGDDHALAGLGAARLFVGRGDGRVAPAREAEGDE